MGIIIYALFWVIYRIHIINRITRCWLGDRPPRDLSTPARKPVPAKKVVTSVTSRL